MPCKHRAAAAAAHRPLVAPCFFPPRLSTSASSLLLLNLQVGRSFSFTRSSSVNSATGSIPAGRNGDGGSVVSSAAATPRGDAYSEASEAFYDPHRAAAAALQQQLTVAAAAAEAAIAERDALAASNAALQAEVAAAQQQLAEARELASQLDSRAAVAEDSRAVTGTVRWG